MNQDDTDEKPNWEQIRHKNAVGGVLVIGAQIQPTSGGVIEMSPEHAATIKSLSERQSRTPKSGAPGIRLAELPVSNRVERLVQLVALLLRETETLARDKAFTDSSGQLRSLDVAGGIDFNEEVRQFEIGLIKLGLDHAGRSQAKAARLLGLKPTTLNSKIKTLGIEY